MSCCKQYVPLISDYIEGELPAVDRNLLDEHFRDCEKCRTFLDSFKNSLQLLEYLEENACPPEVEERLDILLAQRFRPASGSDR